MNLHFKHTNLTGWQEVVNPAGSPSAELKLALFHGQAGEIAERVDEGREAALVILGGRCRIAAEGQGDWSHLGEREDVFSGHATAVYLPAGIPYRIEAETQVEIAIYRAPALPGGEAFVVRPSEVRCRTVGRDSFRREVCDILGEAEPVSRLVVGETYNEPGSWSSYVPHKHDMHDPPREARMQEIYHYRLQPAQGFGLQRIYSPERSLDLAFAVENGDSVLIPFGYHPVVTAPGYRLYYLWALAGEGRTLHPREDPAHTWVTQAKAVL